MSAEKRLNDLAERKRLLVLQSDLHRAVLLAEAANARARLQWVVEARQKFSSGPAWLAGSAVAGVLVAKNWRRALKLLPVGLTAWRWIKKFRSGATDS